MTKGVSRRSPFHDITRSCHRWPGTGPTPRTNQAEECKARLNWQSCPQKYFLKQNEPQARLSILILSKAYSTEGILSPFNQTCKAFGLRGLFCRKAVKSRSLIAGYSLQVLVQLPILGEHLSNSMHGKKIIFCYPINHVHQPHLSLLTLCGKKG